MHDFILNIDNKEVLIEILHYAIDCLIEPTSSTLLSPSSASAGNSSSQHPASSSSNHPTGGNPPSASTTSGAGTALTPSSSSSALGGGGGGAGSFGGTSLHHKFGFATADECDAAVRHLGQLVRRHACGQLSDEALLRQHFGHLPAAQQQSVLDALAARRQAVERHLLCEFNGRSRPLLQAIDWDVRWVLGSSELAGLRKQMATMVLQCRRTPEDRGVVVTTWGMGEGVVFEMDRVQVQAMIEELQECERRMDGMREG